MFYLYFKRIFDIVVSAVLIALASPVWLITALAIKLTSPGPIFFIQQRGGRDCRPFNSLKFRSMRSDHRHDPNEMHIPLSHSSITPVGRFLRRTKIDESPQLINVLKGNMSLIGPRPTIMEQVLAYDDVQRRRQDVRPGITGLAQVNGGTAISWEERIKYDVYYVEHMNFWLDFHILLKTLIVVPFGDSYFRRAFDESPYAHPNSRQAWL
jgi:lipopolysaccharide/colanic/teichoic acid biosynthesis glycosyltransferase